jgi:hypothetical protein
MTQSRSVTATERLLKQPGESRLLGIDFELVLETGEALDAVSGVTGSPSGLTIGSGSIDGTEVRFRVSGGVHNRNYRLAVTVTTDAGNTLVGDAVLEVRDQ